MKVTRIVQQKKSNYKFKVDQNIKTLHCIASGYFSIESATAYIEEFENLVDTIEDIENYTLIVDAREQKEVQKDVLPLLKKAINLYIQIPFRGRQYVMIDNISALTQILCEAGEDFISSFQPIDGNILNKESEAVNSSLASHLLNSTEYVRLSKKGCFYFNVIKDNLPNSYQHYLFEYEDTHSQIESILLDACNPLLVTNK